jgi:hypothetical protein
MGRWTRVVFLVVVLISQMHAQSVPEPASPDQTKTVAQDPVKEDPADSSKKIEAAPDSTSETAAPSTEKSDFPLDAFTEFSAIMVGSIMEHGEGESEGFIYRSGNMLRMEGPEGRGYYLTNLNSHETYGISAGPCMHDVHPYYRASPFAASTPGAKIERSAAGKETVNGHSCQIEDVKVTSAKPGSQPLKMRIWEADDLKGFPIKIEVDRAGTTKSIIQYKNVVLARQDPTLFIHPNSCQSLPQKPGTAKHRTRSTAKKPAAAASQ